MMYTMEILLQSVAKSKYLDYVRCNKLHNILQNIDNILILSVANNQDA